MYGAYVKSPMGIPYLIVRRSVSYTVGMYASLVRRSRAMQTWFWERVGMRYHRLCSVSEIEDQPILQ